MKIFNTVQDLKEARLTAGQLTETKGYHSAGDGGQSRYLIQTSAEFGGTPDEYGNHTLANGNVAVLQVEGDVNVFQFGATASYVDHSNKGSDDREAFQAAINTGLNVYVPKGRYRIDGEELLFINSGQMMYGDGCGSSYGPSLDRTHISITDIVFTGSGTKYIQTRRQPRETSADPQDAPLSVGINLRAEGVKIKDLAVKLSVDYSDFSPANLGDNWDVGIMVGCAHNQLENVRVYGYWRDSSIRMDGTKSALLPQFTTSEGIPWPAPTFSGTDQVSFFNVLSKGGRKGFFIAGAKNGTSGNYYDELSATTYTGEGSRGTAGMSDFHAIDCTFWGPDHHSLQRQYDPRGDMNFDLEDIDLMAGGLFIDGRRSPGNFGGRTRRLLFTNLRVRSFEAVKVGLGAVSELYITQFHTENGNFSNVTDTTGNVIDYNTSSFEYGPIAVTTPTDGEATGSVGTTGVYIFGSASMILPTTHFQDKFERWSVFGTGGGSTGGRSYIHDLRLASDTLQLRGAGVANSINTIGKGLVLTYSSSVRTRILEDSSELVSLPSGNIRLKQGDDAFAFTVGSSITTTNRLFSPAEDNNIALGRIATRWSELRAANGTINTSDGREKQDIVDIPNDVLDAWGDVEWKQYRWIKRVEEKGENARTHFGVIAQQVKQAFDNHGLDPFKYSILCYEEWDEEPEIKETLPAEYDDEGNEITPEREEVTQHYRPAGNRYGIRYDHAEALEAAYQRRKIKQLEDRIILLEEKDNV